MPAATTCVAPTERAPDADAELLESLRARQEAAYVALVRRYTPLMLRLARPHLPNQAVTEEVVQDTWCSVLTGIDAFEGRSSFKTWLLRILLNTARTRAQREHRTLALSCVPGEAVAWEPLLEPVAVTPETSVVAAETFAAVGDALDLLPTRQRAVFVLRDLDGCTASEVCARLGITSGNQRVLLHRARAHLRAALPAATWAGRATRPALASGGAG
ncbi:RNA polymerase sigma factor [Actinomycetospora lemnae]|uniref:RNA polymerase sigma factor n=1 Tax=Actinomycetospora lemnae TaxID=3019891 RepID=A0ABT5SZG4_9PSEU|nr:RNA polymerase sigma factor [Actinomycetospora sp. DW7H6]MDD7967820.1 RNA polymerase sigma factor [Actinomycetospora sp. DW7H6]